MALDQFGRHISYLRISLTDHCNLRCVYCMPEDMTFRPNAELMQDDEIMLFTRLFASLGFHKIRLTGGEPTLRAHVVELVREITHTPGIQSVSITTNGVMLSQLAKPLADAGLDRVNISLWQGIFDAEEAGLTPIKINAVGVRGYNESDVLEIARLTTDHPWQVRFIEMMPFAGATELQIKQVVNWEEIRERIENVFGTLEPVGNGKLDGEARLFHFPGAIGDIGFISSVTKPFCADCNRARLTADGRLRLCLLREKEVDLLTPLRDGAGLEDLRQMILDGIWHKPWGHGLADGIIPLNRVMNEIGG
jgi:cyclic pyranopterin phosphate synthase